MIGSSVKVYDERSHSPHCHVQIHDGITTLTYKVEHVTIDMAKEIVAHRIHHVSPFSYPTLVDISSVLFVEDAALRYFASEGMCLIDALALILKDEFGDLAQRSFRQLRPSAPVKAFYTTQKAQALNWLRQMSFR